MRKLAPALVAAATAAVFLPLLNNGFVRWDDWRTLVENPDYRGLGLSQLRWMFTTLFFCNYQPVSWLTFGVDYAVWGLRPAGYHLTSVLFHCANAVAFYFVALRLIAGKDKPGDADRLGAGFAALLFSLHPLRVEPVAWASARRDVVSGLFFLLGLLAWLRRRRGLALLAHLLSLLAKASTVPFPAVLLLLDWYPLRRNLRTREPWLEKIPFFALSAAFAALGAYAQSECGAIIPLAKSGLADRAAHALFGLTFYLGKTLWPAGLSPVYARTALDGAAVAALVLLAAMALRPRARPAVLAASAYYVLMLLPVLGLFQLGSQAAADRYTYLPGLAWALLAGAALASAPRGLKIGAAAALVALSALSVRQGAVWRDSTSLWRWALRLDPIAAVSRPNLAIALLDEGRTGEAILYLEEQARLFPGDSDSKNRLAGLIAEAGPAGVDYARIHEELAREFAARGEKDKAEWHLRKARSRTVTAGPKRRSGSGTAGIR